MKTLITQGHLLDALAGKDGIYDILIEDGVVKEVAENISTDVENVIDADGCYVMPGFIDLHVHLREPGFEYKETVATGTMAAARGGYTSVCPMPNTMPVMDSPEKVKAFFEICDRDAVVHVLPVGAVTVGQAGKELADIAGMKEAGIVAVSEDGKSVMDTRVYRDGMRLAAEASLPVFAHCEDKVLVGKGALNAGAKAQELGVEGISNAVEDIIVARDILLAKETGARLHLCHCSTSDSAVLTKMAKEQGLPVTAEVCPHHFTMSDDEIPGDDANYKMNPPLRSRADVEALKQALADGVMDAISTDHAPHSAEEKAKPIAQAPFGIVGSETAFALAVTELVKPGILTRAQLQEKMSANPAAIAGIDKGTLAPGRAADVVIVDFDAEYTIDASKFVSKGKNTPFDGKKVCGRVLKTLVDGNVVYDYEQEK